VYYFRGIFKAGIILEDWSHPGRDALSTGLFFTGVSGRACCLCLHGV